MNHHFPLPEGGELLLHRYPKTARHGLQAWEAADEYIINELTTQEWDHSAPLLIINDAFGALTLALHQYQPYSLTDSRVAELALATNAHDNKIEQSWQLLSSLSPWPNTEPAPGLVLLKLPKTKALLEYQLAFLSQIIGPQTQVIAAAKAKEIHTSTLALFERSLGPSHTSLAWKKARLIFSKRDPQLPASNLPEPLAWPLPNSDFTIYNHASVFSRSNLDIGARFFLQHLPDDLVGEVADLGCGNGVLGLRVLQVCPQTRVLFADESYMAVASARLNVQHNRPQDLARSEFWVGNGLAGREGGSLDAVLCNPPFHQQHSITDQVAWDMFVAARRCLKRNGVLYIVGNRHLDYYQKLRRLFGNCITLGMNRKFVVLKAVKTANSPR